MPVMDGFEATAAIRQIELGRSRTDASSPSLIVYALSGLASPEDKTRAATIGFNG